MAGLKIEDIVDPRRVSIICPAASMAQNTIVKLNPIKNPIMISLNAMLARDNIPTGNRSEKL